MRASVWSLLGISVLVVFGFGCGDGGRAGGSGEPPVVERSGPAPAEKEKENAAADETVEASHCPADLAGCRTAKGRITFVERVDPDGDGDAHFVILDSQSITLPGLTAIDVRKGLRPNPLPGVGDLISVAGPVQTGSYDQNQIHAVELHVAGR